jgi:predicted dehydrogenase
MKVSFVGCGAFCSGTHIPNVARNPGFQLVGLCDLSTERLQTLEKQFHPQYVTQDLERIFRDPQVDLVICGTKPDFRLPIMRLAAQHGKHLFVEKPLCYRDEDIPEMVHLMRHAPKLFMVGFNRPYSPIMQAVKPLFQNQREGDTTLIYRIIGEGDLWPPTHKQAIYDRRESTIIHEVTHIFDLLNWLTDREPTRVYTAGGGNTNNVITLSYPDDITAVIIAGDNGTHGYPKERLEINTNFSCIIAEDFIELRAVRLKDGNLLRTFPFRQGGQILDTGLQDAMLREQEWRDSITPAEQAYGYYYDRMVVPDKGHYGELECFRRMIDEGGPSQTDVVRGALANLIAEAAMESWHKHLPIDLDFRSLREG